MRSGVEVEAKIEQQPGQSRKRGKELGVVAGLFIGRERSKPMQSVSEVTAIAGEGLEGDRKRGLGIPMKEITLIETEALDASARDYDIDIKHDEPRRNVLTRAVGLNHLVGREFYVGLARLRGLKLCEPCTHLEGLTGKEMIKALRHRGGLRAEIVESGVIRVGDIIGEAE